jgi:hypothetical protein
MRFRRIYGAGILVVMGLTGVLRLQELISFQNAAYPIRFEGSFGGLNGSIVYFIVTSSLGETITRLPGEEIKLNKEVRVAQYRRCVGRLLQLTNGFNAKIVLVEGNGRRKTSLDELGVDVLYTENNKLKTKNKGRKELQDVLDCIAHYNISESDFVVKMTGRYLIHSDSPFLKALAQPNFDQDCVVKFGNYMAPLNYQVKDCVTALIGMRAKYIKQIRMPGEDEPVERAWAEATYLMNQSKVLPIKGPLGMDICPASDTYFSI